MSTAVKAIGLGALVVLVDQAAKLLVEPLGMNDAGAFGIAPVTQPVIVLLIIALAAAADAVRWQAVALMIGGALSNLTDRMRYGAVRDPFPAGPYAWNLADIAILAGALMLAFFPPRKIHAHERRG